MGDKEVILNVNRLRFKCKKCQNTFSQKLDFVEERRGYTHRYAENIVRQVINSDVSNVAVSLILAPTCLIADSTAPEPIEQSCSA
jgi:transposase